MEVFEIRTKRSLSTKKSWDKVKPFEFTGLFRFAIVEAFLSDERAQVCQIRYKSGGYTIVITRDSIKGDPNFLDGLL